MFTQKKSLRNQIELRLYQLPSTISAVRIIQFRFDFMTLYHSLRTLNKPKRELITVFHHGAPHVYRFLSALYLLELPLTSPWPSHSTGSNSSPTYLPCESHGPHQNLCAPYPRSLQVFAKPTRGITTSPITCRTFQIPYVLCVHTHTRSVKIAS